MRYFVGTMMLYWIGTLGGNILLSALLIGLAYGFIDSIRGRIR